jgi:hypothetical protein
MHVTQEMLMCDSGFYRKIKMYSCMEQVFGPAFFDTYLRLNCDSIATPLVLTSIYLHAILLNAGRKEEDERWFH